MKVLLAEAPYHELYGSQSMASVRRYFPLGIGYISAFLIREGIDVSLFIQSQDNDFRLDLAEKIRTYKPDLVGISSMTPAYPYAVEMAKIIKNIQDVPIVIGGPHATASGENILRECPEIDFAIYGEGELSCLDLCKAVAGTQKPFRDVMGLIWRDSGKIIYNPPRPMIDAVDNIPFPARHLVDMSFFTPHSHMSIGKNRSTTMLSSRGCPSHCVFCDSHITMGRTHRGYSPEYVVDELELLMKDFGIEFVVIQDDTFTADIPRVEKICERIIKKKLNIEWNCYARAFEIKRPLAKLMSDAGCKIIFFGIESGNPDIFKSLRKGGSLEAVKRAVAVCNKIGIRTMGSFIVGHVGETMETYQDTIRYSQELNPTIAMFFPLIPFPGTQVWREEFKPETVDGWKNFLTLADPPVSLMEGVAPRDIKKMADIATIRFYARSTQLWRMLRSISSYWELKEYLRSGYAAMRRLMH